MVTLDRLRFSLTKNGYIKLARVLKRHSRWDVLDKVEGKVCEDVDIKRSQAAAILSEDADGAIPDLWDRIREEDVAVVEAFVFVAVIFSHHRLIEIFRGTREGDFTGTVARDDLGNPKEFTNLNYTMHWLEMCRLVKGSEKTEYNMYPLVYRLREVGPLIEELISIKLRRAGWKDPRRVDVGADLPFSKEAERLGFHEIFGMKPAQFTAWMKGTLPELEVKPAKRGSGRSA